MSLWACKVNIISELLRIVSRDVPPFISSTLVLSRDKDIIAVSFSVLLLFVLFLQRDLKGPPVDVSVLVVLLFLQRDLKGLAVDEWEPQARLAENTEAVSLCQNAQVKNWIWNIL